MVQELVLVPKTKYEHLLEQSKTNSLNTQIGGQVTDKGDSEIPESGDNLSVSGECIKKSRINPNSTETESKLSKYSVKSAAELTTNKPKHSNLYVESPLLKMPFSERKPGRKRKSRRKHMSAKSKSKWVNYIV